MMRPEWTTPADRPTLAASLMPMLADLLARRPELRGVCPLADVLQDVVRS